MDLKLNNQLLTIAYFNPDSKKSRGFFMRKIDKMQSFRTELENELVEREIIELERKIHRYKNGEMDEESFRSLRLARGVYGQRQKGVQMVRIKFPLGILSGQQLQRVAEIAQKYSDGNLHLTTRQDIQIHHVLLDHTPKLWEELEEDKITLREACGNTVRNITASSLAGINPKEPFDITSCGLFLFNFFLRNPISQELGRKFKIAISDSEEDTAKVFMHDLGLIPTLKNDKQGFKVFLGGGLGGQSIMAQKYTDFLPIEELPSFSESLVKVFDFYGERIRRNKARFKFLVKELGFDRIKELINDFREDYLVELPVPKYQYQLDKEWDINAVKSDDEHFQEWFKSNVIVQKQTGYYAIGIKLINGNISNDLAYKLGEFIARFSIDDARITIGQNLLIRGIAQEHLLKAYSILSTLNLVHLGFESTADITACPGTETCNLAITQSYPVAQVIENLIKRAYPSFLKNKEFTIKISGCMNSCGQHLIASLGFHGASLKKDGAIIPALQVLIGGATLGNGVARFADKIIKVPSRRVELVVRRILDDYIENNSGLSFNDYYPTKDKFYYYNLLKDIADLTNVDPCELIDWGKSNEFKPEIGVGECAGVKIDLYKTLLYEAYEKIEDAEFHIENGLFADSIYLSHAAILQTAKAFLIKQGIETNSKESIILAFEPFYSEFKSRFLEATFSELLDIITKVSQGVNSKLKVEAKSLNQKALQFQLSIDEYVTRQ